MKGVRALLCGLVAVIGVGTGEAKVLTPRGMVREAPPEVAQDVYIGPKAAIGHVPATRNLLGLERPHPYALPTAESAAMAKTVRVAALRVQFRQESPDDPTTTGNGRFDLRDTLTFFAEEGFDFERAPHNRDFFSAVLRAMAQYYSVVSNGLLTIQYNVFPLAKDSAYTVDSSMAWYGSRPPDEGIAELLTDAVQKADTDPDLVFGDYDAYILFHAGSDGQHDFSPLTPTPNDLFTGYLRLLDPALFVPVDGGAVLVEDAVLLPETATQDNRGSGLGGSVAHEFGHQLGLVDLYNTRTRTTQVGDFSLMDADAASLGVQLADSWRINVFFDLLPTYPDAWSRAFLGFVTPRIVWPDSILAHRRPDPDSALPFFVTVAEGLTPPQVLKVPISAGEYYLIEYRSPDWDRNADAGFDPFGVGIRVDSFSNVVLGPTLCGDFRFPDSCRELGRDYDFQLPVTTGGMLIWHVDEEVGFQLVPELEGDLFLTSNFVANTLQWDRHRRFLEIVEADGLIDFGGNYFTGYGSQRELFLGGFKTEFGPSTNPSTRSHTGAPTHLSMFDISPIYDASGSPSPPPLANLPFHHMQLKIAGERAAAGWPRVAGLSDAPDLAIIPGATTDTVLVSAGRYVAGWTGAGQPLLLQPPGDGAVVLLPRLDGTFDTLILNGLARADTTLASSPSVGTDSGAGVRYVSAVDVTGKVYVWSFDDGDADGWADLDTAFAPGAPVGKPPLWFDHDLDGDEGMFVAAADGNALWWDDGAETSVIVAADSVHDWALARPQGAVSIAAQNSISTFVPGSAPVEGVLGVRFAAIVAADWDRDGNDDLFGHDGRQLYRVRLDPLPVLQDQRDFGFELAGPFSAGDHDSDGIVSLFAATGDRMAAFAPNLVLERNYPLRSNARYPGRPLCDAITFGRQTLFGGADGEVQDYTPDAELVEGWPLFAGGRVLALGTVRAGADSLIVLARSTNGYLWGTEVAGSPRPAGSWTQARGNAAKQNRWDGAGMAQPAPSAAVLPPETVYAYPNPAPRGPVTIRYYLGQPADVELSVYDLAGNEVVRATAAGFAGADNEWVWDASGIAPGIYFCRVRAKAGTDRVEICKVAITP